MAPIKLGIIGYSNSTLHYHIPFILPNPDLQICAFFQRAAPPTPTSTTSKETSKRGEHCTIDFPEARHYRMIEDFCQDTEIELVLVATAPYTHAELAEKVLLAGKHVIVEKPFTATTAEADKLIALSKKVGKILTVYQNRRYDSDFLTIKSLLSLKPFGKIHEAAFHHDLSTPTFTSSSPQREPTPGSSYLFQAGSHSIDQALLVFGPPKSVTAFTRALRGGKPDFEDSFTIILQYEGEQEDLFVEIKTNAVTRLKDQIKCVIRGYEGSYIKFGGDVQVIQAKGGMGAIETGFGEEDSQTDGVLTTREKVHECQTQKGDLCIGKYPTSKGCYVDYYRDVVKAIRGDGELVVKPEQSRDGIRIIEIAIESARKGCTLPFEG